MLLVQQYLGTLPSTSLARSVVIASAFKQQFIGDINKHDALVNFNVDVLVVEIANSAFEVHNEHHVQRIFLDISLCRSLI